MVQYPNIQGGFADISIENSESNQLSVDDTMVEIPLELLQKLKLLHTKGYKIYNKNAFFVFF